MFYGLLLLAIEKKMSTVDYHAGFNSTFFFLGKLEKEMIKMCPVYSFELRNCLCIQVGGSALNFRPDN